MVVSFMSDLNIKSEVLCGLNNVIILGGNRNCEEDILPSWEVHCDVDIFKIVTTCRIDGCRNWLRLCNWNTLAYNVDSLLQQDTQHDGSIECTVTQSITDWHSPSAIIKNTVKPKSCAPIVRTVTLVLPPSLT